MPDADVEPEPCRDCMTPIPPGHGWCQECDRERKACLRCGTPIDDCFTPKRPPCCGRCRHGATTTTLLTRGEEP